MRGQCNQKKKKKMRIEFETLKTILKWKKIDEDFTGCETRDIIVLIDRSDVND